MREREVGGVGVRRLFRGGGNVCVCGVCVCVGGGGTAWSELCRPEVCIFMTDAIIDALAIP